MPGAGATEIELAKQLASYAEVCTHVENICYSACMCMCITCVPLGVCAHSDSEYPVVCGYRKFYWISVIMKTAAKSLP